jgi:osmotically inducible protein OsmC
MALARRWAEVGWEGTLEEGKGSFTVGSWMVGEVPVTWSSRTSPNEESTSPEELMAAAHASCYAMALSLVLDERGTPPESIDVQAACTLDQVPEP